LWFMVVHILLVNKGMSLLWCPTFVMPNVRREVCPAAGRTGQR
jgi:hypothetical protein